MAREIAEQPDSMARLGQAAHRYVEDAQLQAALAEAPRVLFAACGSSRHAALLGRYACLRLAGLCAEVEEAHELLALGPNLWRGLGLCVLLSQSGETQDTLEAQRLAAAQGTPLLAFTNAVPSTLASAARWTWPLLAGPERAVPATKSFLAQASACLTLALSAGEARASKLGRLAQDMRRERDAVRAAQQRLVPALRRLLQQPSNEEAARRLHAARSVVLLGRGPAACAAYEGALKLREGAYVAAQAFAVGEFKHGPLAMLEPSQDAVVVLLEQDPQTDAAEQAARADTPADGRTLQNLLRLADLGVPLVVVTAEDHPALAVLEARAPQILVVQTPPSAALVWPLLATVVLQRLTLRLAELRGVDVDQPRYLTKSIDVH